jgi:AraC family transcriptional regulator, regulatory protein of adaptative response / DNA-3-methyladenine glycosylase II
VSSSAQTAREIPESLSSEDHVRKRPAKPRAGAYTSVVENQDDIFYRAYMSRDHRFDGKFFIAVKTTGVYCRPICPAKPHRKNVEFFPHALSAEKAGYRPCLRCRPECAPLSPAWMGRSATVQRALKLISDQTFPETNEDQFAEQLGVSARHLRRLFDEELGKTPKQISDASRLNFARKLIVETPLPITEISFTSGFSSIRRFNDAFKSRFHRAPTEIRKAKGIKNPDSGIELRLPYRPPFDWHSLIQFYKSHEVSGVEEISTDLYARVFKVDGVLAAMTLSHDPHEHSLLLRVSDANPKCLYRVCQIARQMFDLDCDPMAISEVFSPCSITARLCRQYPGLRIPRGFDPFEIAICTILGQLVSTEQARRLVGQLVEAYGDPVINPLSGNPAHIFPTPEELATSTLSNVGTTQTRKRTINQFSRLVAEKKIQLHSAQDPVLFRRKLLDIEGIGPWSAEYISLRALGDTDAFPSSDLILKRVIQENPDIKLESFKPWRAYAAIYLWKEFARSLSKKRRKEINHVAASV